MRQLLVLLAAFCIAAGLSSPALADSTANYSITGTYGASTASSAFSGAGENFSMDFSLPTNPASLILDVHPGDDFYLYPVNIAYSFAGTTTTLTSLVGFYESTAGTQSGGFFVDYCVNPTCADNLEYQWIFAGPQQYTGSEDNPTLVPTSFASNNQPFVIYDDGALTDTAWYGSINSTINGTLVNTPEPSSMLLLGAGLAGLALIAKFRA